MSDAQPGDLSRSRSSTVRFGPFQFDGRELRLAADATVVAVQPKALDVLACLLDRPGELVLKEELLERGWNGSVVTDKSLVEVIRVLRAALGDDPQAPVYIRTVHSRGYSFVAPVRRVREASRRRAMRSGWRWAAAVVIGTALGLLALLGSSESRVPTPSIRFTVTFPPGEGFARFDLAPDGDSIVYDRAPGERLHGDVGHPLYLRRLDRFDPEPIPGTEGGDTPFFSPDGERIGYFLNGPPRRLVTAARDGSDVRTIAAFDAAVGSGITDWGDDGYIYSLGQPAPGQERGIYRIPEAGGTPEQVVALDEFRPAFVTVRDVQLLPGAAGVILTALPASRSAADAETVAISVPSGQRRVVLRGARGTRYLPSGHLAYERDGEMFMRRLDLASLELVGPELEVEVPAARSGRPARFVVAGDGTLAYRMMTPVTTVLSRIDLDGSHGPLALLQPSDRCHSPDIAADGVAVVAICANRDAVAPGDEDLYVADLVSGVMRRRTWNEGARWARWAPDASRIYYSRYAAGEWSLRSIAVDTDAPPEVLVTDARRLVPDSVSPDGRWLVYTRRDPDTDADLWMVATEGGGGPQPLLVRPANDQGAEISPDGRWIAYESDVEGISEWHVFVAAFPPAGPTGEGATRVVKISTRVGGWPQWRPDGSGLLYMEGTPIGEAILGVDHRSDGSFGPPRELFVLDDFRILQTLAAAFRVAPDGDSLLGSVAARPQHSLRVVENWIGEVTGAEPVNH